MIKKNKGLSVFLVEGQDSDYLEKRLGNLVNFQYIDQIFVINKTNKKIDYKHLQEKFFGLNITIVSEKLSTIEILNKLILELQNEFFIILGNDEFFYQKNLSFLIEKFFNNDEINLIYTNSIFKDPNDNFLGFCETLLPYRFLENVNHINEITLGSFLIRKSLFKKIGFFNKKYKKKLCTRIYYKSVQV